MKLRLFTAIAFTAMAVISCNEETASIGKSLTDEDDKLQVLCALADIKGEAGANGKQVKLQKYNGYIQWQYEGDSGWTDLVPLSELKGELAADVDLRLKRGVVIKEANPDEGTAEETEDQIQYKAKDAEDIDANWKKLCTVDEFGLTVTVTPVEKQSWSAENAAPSMTLESGKKYSPCSLSKSIVSKTAFVNSGCK